MDDHARTLRELAQSLGPVVGLLADPSWDGEYDDDGEASDLSYEERLETASKITSETGE